MEMKDNDEQKRLLALIREVSTLEVNASQSDYLQLIEDGNATFTELIQRFPANNLKLF